MVTMNSPTLLAIDEIRKEGMRPQVVGCFVYNKKVLFVYSEEYSLWQFPQGGIDNNETISQAIKREMTEELGEVFMSRVKEGVTCVGKDSLIFPENKQGSRAIQTDSGEEIFMLGKTYFFVVLHSTTENLTMAETEFDECMWLPYEQALRLAQNIYQKGKKRITLVVLEKLREGEYI